MMTVAMTDSVIDHYFSRPPTIGARRRELEQRLEAVRRQMEETSALPAEGREARVSRARTNFKFFCETYLPHYFNEPWSPAHHQMAQDCDRRSSVVVLFGFRGLGKSSIVQHAYTIHDLLYGLSKFSVIGSKSLEMAEEKCFFILFEFLENPRIRDDFGETVRNSSTAKAGWFFMRNGSCLRAVGIGQSIRGWRNGPHRVDRFVGDDLEDESTAGSEKMSKKLLFWLTGGVFKAFPNDPQKRRMILLGTALHPRCALVQLQKKGAALSPEFADLIVSRKYPVRDEQGKYLWPEVYGAEQEAMDRELMGTAQFTREMMCEAQSELNPFREEWIKYYDEEDLRKVDLSVYLYCDPSAKAKECNDFKALVLLGYARPKKDDARTDKFYILHAWIRHASTEELCDAGIDIWCEWHPHGFGIEDVGFQAEVGKRIEERARQRNVKGLYVRPVPVKGAKEDRIIGTLQAPFERGKILFRKNHSDQNILIEQFIQFPEGKIDGPDATEGAVRMAIGTPVLSEETVGTYGGGQLAAALSRG